MSNSPHDSRRNDDHAPSREHHDGSHQGRESDGERRDRGGPPGTEFLDLEISKVMYAEAESVVRQAVSELMREAVKARLRERLGAQIIEIANLATDEFVDDILTNLEIEKSIEERQQRRASLDGQLREITKKIRRG